MQKQLTFKKTDLLLLLLGLILIPARPAHAYLDPGTGSYAIQILVGVLFGAGYMIKVFWSRIISFFHRRKEAKASKSTKSAPEKTSVKGAKKIKKNAK